MNPRKSSGTAYLACSGRLLAEVVEALGKADDAANYRDTAANAVKAYRTAFTENGVIHSDHQRVFVRCAGKIRLCGHCLQAAFQSDALGWLYEVGEDATTAWETWTGIDENGKPHESLNHYSYGAICGWLFGGVCGI